MEESKINTDEELIIEQIPENPKLDNPALGYKKNLIRLLILSGLGFITIILLGISFFFIFIKI